MGNNQRVCAITGSSGYLGFRLLHYFSAHGWDVVAMQRSTPAGNMVRHLPYSLEQPVDPQHLKGVDLLIHCAYDFSCLKWADIARVNVEGPVRLFFAARDAGGAKASLCAFSR